MLKNKLFPWVNLEGEIVVQSPLCSFCMMEEEFCRHLYGLKCSSCPNNVPLLIFFLFRLSNALVSANDVWECRSIGTM